VEQFLKLSFLVLIQIYRMEKKDLQSGGLLNIVILIRI